MNAINTETNVPQTDERIVRQDADTTRVTVTPGEEVVVAAVQTDEDRDQAPL